MLVKKAGANRDRLGSPELGARLASLASLGFLDAPGAGL
jgi:hypothetical protein